MKRTNSLLSRLYPVLVVLLCLFAFSPSQTSAKLYNASLMGVDDERAEAVEIEEAEEPVTSLSEGENWVEETQEATSNTVELPEEETPMF